jgi:hypothetical protein
VFAGCVTFPSASTGPVVIGVTFVLFVVASPFKVSFPTLPADTGVVPEANGADTVPNVSSVAMI